jgi:hypothetical protein
VSRFDVRLVTCETLPTEDPDTPILAAALRAAGARVDIAGWRDATVDWAASRVTVLRSPWDYVAVVDAFTAWVKDVARVTALWNPVELVTWNVHKSYLLDLAERGAPIVPTVLLMGGSAAALDGICDAQGWNTVVVKPAVGIGGIGSGRFDVGDPDGQTHLDELLARGEVLVQPFVAGIAAEGERSVVLFDGVASHALQKMPRAGEYRVHEEYGGRTELVALGDGAAALAERVVAALPAPALYARIDMLRYGDAWHVLEVEATEPSLWLDQAPPSATDRFVAAVMARVQQARPLR